MPLSQLQLSLQNSKKSEACLLLSRLQKESASAESELWQTNESASQ